MRTPAVRLHARAAAATSCCVDYTRARLRLHSSAADLLIVLRYAIMFCFTRERRRCYRHDVYAVDAIRRRRHGCLRCCAAMPLCSARRHADYARRRVCHATMPLRRASATIYVYVTTYMCCSSALDKRAYGTRYTGRGYAATRASFYCCVALRRHATPLIVAACYASAMARYTMMRCRHIRAPRLRRLIRRSATAAAAADMLML